MADRDSGLFPSVAAAHPPRLLAAPSGTSVAQTDAV